MKIDAIIWDYDGTLVNSVPKNINITKEILDKVAPRLSGNGLPIYLKNEKEYHYANHASRNWQDLYLNYYGLTEKETLEAGRLWTEYQLKNTTPVNLFPEISETVKQLKCPQGICSQNSALNIQQVMREHNLLDRFDTIIGYDDIPDNAQKPSPISGIICLERIFGEIEKSLIMYIGDHVGDVQFARNIESELNDTNKVLSVAVNYSGANISSWTHQPDYIITTPLDLLKLTK
ncbi:MAG: HAD hydrolase-like protein [Bacteroidales bacterium]|jgi:phosphoglycolate phosphatase-like HAD superfamily hydrolase|nr:HAD hydrolase-like protein [Bacteroidales bacterium]